MRITGTLVKKTPFVPVSPTFGYMEIWVQTNGKYPQTIKIQLNNDKRYLVDNIQEGDEVDVSIYINGRLYKSKDTGEENCFNTIVGYEIFTPREVQPQPQPQYSFQGNPNIPAPPVSNTDDELPF